MFVYVFLPFVSLPVFADALQSSGYFTRGSLPSFPKTDRISNVHHPEYRIWITSTNGTHPRISVGDKGVFGEGYEYPKPENDEADFDKASNALKNVEIFKSIEFKFDPKTKMFIPVMDVQGEGEGDDSKSKQVLLLLSLKTHKRLQKIFEKLEKDEKSSGVKFRRDKNFQTGRFKYKFKSV